MDKPIIHPKTKQDIDSALIGTHHALALIGPYGAGKTHLALWLAKYMLGAALRPERIKVVAPDNGSLGIDQIREVTSFLRLKTAGTENIRRVVIVEDAHTLTQEAQNALLKTLEEPPEDTRIILTVIGRKTLLPTIYSRVYSIDVLPITQKEFLAYLGKNTSSEEAKRAFAISGGLAGLGIALLQDKEHELTLSIAKAKDLLTKTAYERLLEIDDLIKHKETVPPLLFALKRVLSAGSVSAKEESLKRIIKALRAVHEAETKLLRNTNLKLNLTNVMLSI